MPIIPPRAQNDPAVSRYMIRGRASISMDEQRAEDERRPHSSAAGAVVLFFSFVFLQELRMNVRRTGWMAIVAAFAGWLGFTAPAAHAVPISVDLTALRAAQLYSDKATGDDPAYVLVTGV